MWPRIEPVPPDRSLPRVEQLPRVLRDEQRGGEHDSEADERPYRDARAPRDQAPAPEHQPPDPGPGHVDVRA